MTTVIRKATEQRNASFLSTGFLSWWDLACVLGKLPGSKSGKLSTAGVCHHIDGTWVRAIQLIFSCFVSYPQGKPPEDSICEFPFINSFLHERKKKRRYSEHLWGARHKLELRDRERGVFILKEKDGQRDNEWHVAARAGSEVRKDAKNLEEEASSSAQLVAIPVHTEGSCCCKF